MKQQYKVLQSNGPEDIGKQVTDHLNNGWELIGSIFVVKSADSYGGPTYDYFQSMMQNKKCEDLAIHATRGE